MPDADLLYAGSALQMGKLGYLLHHRGHTHTIVVALVGALAVWAAALALWRGAQPKPERRALLAVALVGVLSHIALDFTNNYGVHPFWPIDNRWLYGDAVFIVEPWLWIVSIPALLALAHRAPTRALYGVLLAAIVAAAWFVPMVSTGAAVAATIGAGLWLTTLALLRHQRRLVIFLGVSAWTVVEAIFLTASSASRTAVLSHRKTNAPERTVHDVALTPFVANPLCYDVIVVETQGDEYHVSRATAAPFPRVQDAATCNAARTRATMPQRAADAQNVQVSALREQWSGSLAEFARLSTTSCEFRAALRFARVPAWVAQGEQVTLRDLRFSESGGGFADVTLRANADECRGWIPPWTPPMEGIQRQATGARGTSGDGRASR